MKASRRNIVLFGKKGQITGGEMALAYTEYTYKKNGRQKAQNYNRYGFKMN